MLINTFVIALLIKLEYKISRDENITNKEIDFLRMIFALLYPPTYLIIVTY